MNHEKNTGAVSSETAYETNKEIFENWKSMEFYTSTSAGLKWIYFLLDKIFPDFSYP